MEDMVCPDCKVERADYEGPNGAWLPKCGNCGSSKDPVPSTSPERADAYKALHCLNYELDPSIVRDVTSAVKGALDAADATIAQLAVERNALLDRLRQAVMETPVLESGGRSELARWAVDATRHAIWAKVELLLAARTNRSTHDT